jgi:glutamate synthase domain-containing protein 3
MVDLETVWQEDDIRLLYELIQKHYKWTTSKRASQILDNWADMVGRFVKVMPIDYRKSLERLKAKEGRQSDFTAATEEVYHG